MRLRVKTVGGADVEVDADESLPRAVTRAQVQSALGLDDEEINLIHKGKIIDPAGDDETLISSGIKEGDVIVAVARRGECFTNRVRTEESTPQPADLPNPINDEELARQMQVDEDETVAKKLQEDIDQSLAEDIQAQHNMGDRAPPPQLLFISGEFTSINRFVPLMVDTGAQSSVLTSHLAEQLGLVNQIDRRFAGVVGGVGTARVVGKLSNLEVRFGELPLAVDFTVLDSTQMPHKSLAILGLDQLAVHHMVVDMDRRVVLVGGCDGYAVRILDPHEIPAEFRLNSNPMQQCSIQ
eukprot:TRINITY_DN18118_c0_g1_i1.p1 TRINITY_DN18118_c0_g1~~TRINITY_DN18118_c0_g1_i1.p1  ORF type:complete len:296 (+),score=49.75 TRINITY_DN18118_c0_g1_i1:134-1021(+)